MVGPNISVSFNKACSQCITSRVNLSFHYQSQFQDGGGGGERPGELTESRDRGK